MFDRVFQSSTTQEQVYNACAQKIVKGEVTLLFLSVCLHTRGMYSTNENEPAQLFLKYQLKYKSPLNHCFNEFCVVSCRCSGGIQWNNFCIWADIIWQNTHHGGKDDFQELVLFIFKRSASCFWIEIFPSHHYV